MNELEFKMLMNQRLCDVADAILHYYNPCNIVGNSCTLTNDIRNDPLHCCYRSIYSAGRDDRHCPFQVDDKCTFRNLKCKTWLCETAIQKTSLECIEALKLLEGLGKLYGLVGRPYIGEKYAGKGAEIAQKV